MTSGVALEELDELFHRAREHYEGWLDTVLRASATAAADTDVPVSELQRSIHERHVRRSGDSPLRTCWSTRFATSWA